MIAICGSIAACTRLPNPSPDPPTQIPRDCEEQARPVDGPAWFKGANAKALLVDTTVALKEANANLGATRTCQAHQRETFARPSRVTE